MKRPVVLFVAFALGLSALPALASPSIKVGPRGLKCRDAKDAALELSVPVEGETATGKYTLPAADPNTLVVFGHGYGHKSDSWVEHMKEAAAKHGVLAVTMDYRGTYVDKDGILRGWFVKEGAQDMVAATNLLQDSCPTIERTILFGISMGGNSTGLAVAQAADETNATGGPLFDYWFNIEGAVNVLETYAGASLLAPANAYASRAKADIEDEMGGKTFEQDPEGYADLAVVSHIDAIGKAGLKGVVMVHAIEDGLVPYNQSREFVPLLLSQGIPTQMYTVFGKGKGESGTTITGYSSNNSSPFAGHASETSNTHLVMVTALDRLWSLVDDDVQVPPYSEEIVPGL